VQVTVIGIFGPTASGKSLVGEAVAERLGGEVVSADAMQVYRGLPILTNQSPARLVAIWPLEKEASLGEYAPLAHATIDGLLDEGRTPVVVGGTGLYFRAALGELDLPPAPAPGARERWGAAYDADPAAAYARLRELDPRAAAVSTRTTSAASSARSSWPRREPRSGRPRTASGPSTRAARR